MKRIIYSIVLSLAHLGVTVAMEQPSAPSAFPEFLADAEYDIAVLADILAELQNAPQDTTEIPAATSKKMTGEVSLYHMAVPGSTAGYMQDQATAKRKAPALESEAPTSWSFVGQDTPKELLPCAPKKTKEPREIKSFKCGYPNCDHTASKLQNLERHISTHLPETHFKCPAADCDYTAVQRNNFNRHIKNTHLKLKMPKITEIEKSEKRAAIAQYMPQLLFKCKDPKCPSTFYSAKAAILHFIASHKQAE